MKRSTYVAVALVVAVVAGAALWRIVDPPDDAGTVEVVHWVNSHPMRPELLPEMAEEFNDDGHTTKSGKRIEVAVLPYDSVAQVDDVTARVTGKGPRDRAMPDPTIITPQAEHWLTVLNHDAGRPVVDASDVPSIARTVVGIVTYREMAECLGWPDKAIGYADIIALRDDPAGWRKYPCAKQEWGRTPLLAFTNPRTSTTGRSVLISLYSMATGKAPEQLTVADVQDPAAQDVVKHFAGLVDHYYPGTIPLNTKVYQGPKFGQFFLMPEDNLVRLYKGNEKAIDVDGQEVEAPPIDEPMVMIYPKEGATWHSHPAAVVDAPWVSDEQREGASEWIEFLRADDQQARFLKAGFRPGTELPLASPIDARFGADPSQPETSLRTNQTDPAVIQAILDSWGAVKRPAVVTFVIDTSGSMNADGRIDQAKDGLLRSLDVMSGDNYVGLVAFSDKVHTRIPPGVKRDTASDIADAVEAMTANGGTSLYDAIVEGIRMSDGAASSDDAIRAVVVLSDGLSNCNVGEFALDDIVDMSSTTEAPIASFAGTECATSAQDVRGVTVDPKSVLGQALKLPTGHPVQVFFVGVGEADIQVGRILAQATGAEYQGTTEDDLAEVLEAVSDYF